MDMRPEIARSPHLALAADQSASFREAPRPDGTPKYDLKRAFGHIRRRLGVIVASVALGASLSLAVAILHKPYYTATALLSVNATEDDGSGRGDDSWVDTQIAMLQSSVFVDRAFETLSREQRASASLPRAIDLERRLKVNQVMRSRLVAVNFSDKSPVDAAEIANMIARLYVEDPLLQGVQSLDDANDTLSRQIAALETELQRLENQEAKEPASNPPGVAMGVKASDLRDQIAGLKLSQTLARRRDESRQQTLALSPPVQLVALAKPPQRPSSLNSTLIVVPAIIFSWIFGVALALVLGALDKRIYLLSDLKEAFAFPCVGAIPARRRRVLATLARAQASDIGSLRAIDDVVAGTLLLQKVQRRVILVTTSEEDDEASEFALSLASAAARMHQRVLFVDLDIAPPRQRLLGRRKPIPGPNAFDVLAGRCPASAAIRNIPGSDLDHLPSGHDGEVDLLALIACGRLKQLVAQLRSTYDWVILIGPPVIGVSATRLIAAAADTTILVVKSKVSRFPAVRDALNLIVSSMTLDAFGDVSPQIVTVLTDAPRRSVPAAFRDKRAAKRSDALFRPSSSVAQSPSDVDSEMRNESPHPDDGGSRLIPSHGFLR